MPEPVNFTGSSVLNASSRKSPDGLTTFTWPHLQRIGLSRHLENNDRIE